MTEYCGTCSYHNENICLLHNRQIDLTSSYCEAHNRTALLVCEKCGRPILKNPFLLEDSAGNFHVFCNNCIQGAKV